MAEKLYNLIKKYNYLPFVATVCLFVNNILITFFKNTSFRPTYSCRAFMLVSALLLFLGAVLEIYKFVYAFVRSKKNGDVFERNSQIKQILSFLFLILACGVALWAFIKYFTDFAIYFLHNNNTGLIIVSAMILFICYYCISNFEKIKAKYIDFILIGIIALTCYVCMLCKLENINISMFYIYDTMTVVACAMLFVNFYQQIFKNVSICAFYIVSWLMILATIIATIINRSSINLYNMVFVFGIIACSIVAVVTCNCIHGSNKLPLVYRIVTVAIALFLYFKISYFDKSLKAFDVSRLMMMFMLTTISLGMLRNYREKLSIVFMSSIGATTVAYAISASIIFCQKIYAQPFYIVEIVFLSVFMLIAFVYVIVNGCLSRKGQKQEK